MRRVVMAAVLMGCSEKEVEDSGGAPPLSTESTEDTAEEEEVCFGAPPNIDTFTVENTGLATKEANEEELPTLTFTFEVTDTDGDLDVFTLVILYDQMIDRDLDDATAGSITIEGSLGDACSSSAGTIMYTLYMGGGELEYNSLYEWGAVLTDARGMSSGMAVQTYETPDEDGN